jgi:DNA-directed RNA polymerase sigma subunit (sigma70/sigma32)
MSVFKDNGERIQRARPPEPVQYKELAKRFGVCWQRIRQIEYRAIEKLREAIASEAEAAGVSPGQWLRGE